MRPLTADNGSVPAATDASSRSFPAPRRAAALVIGNELLSGKVAEANVVVLAKALRELGIVLARVVMVLDDVAVIADEVRSLSAAYDVLFTSGGVGPTHDDVTVEGVARAFGARVIEHPELVAMLRAHYGSRCTEGHLRMALVPEGASLETAPEVRWPTIRFGNTWLLPGVPGILSLKLPVALAHLGGDTAFLSSAVYTNMDEGDLKPMLDAVVARFPDVEVGSYPKWQDSTYRTKLTFDGRAASRVDEARNTFIAMLPEGEPQRVD